MMRRGGPVGSNPSRPTNPGARAGPSSTPARGGVAPSRPGVSRPTSLGTILFHLPFDSRYVCTNHSFTCFFVVTLHFFIPLLM